jgi:hypothetical protein
LGRRREYSSRSGWRWPASWSAWGRTLRRPGPLRRSTTSARPGPRTSPLRPLNATTPQLEHHFVNTQGALTTYVELSPVGLDSKSPIYTYGGPKADQIVHYNYRPRGQVSVGVHVKYLMSVGVQDNSANPYIVSYPR